QVLQGRRGVAGGQRLVDQAPRLLERGPRPELDRHPALELRRVLRGGGPGRADRGRRGPLRAQQAARRGQTRQQLAPGHVAHARLLLDRCDRLASRPCRRSPPSSWPPWPRRPRPSPCPAVIARTSSTSCRTTTPPTRSAPTARASTSRRTSTVSPAKG